ncbi:MAG: hypothetical protein M1819_002536 [Sarea resinae]|nr:MAG: hypothetical protein M1819_002536 [Sarea resinae]
MAPSAVPIDGFGFGGLTESAQLPPTAKLANIGLSVDETAVTVPPHPLGIKPSGNAYTASQNLKSACPGFSSLTDDLIIQILEFCDDSSLLRLGATCKALYAFTRFDELWKALFLEYISLFFTVVLDTLLKNPSDFTWLGTWRNTYLSLPPCHTSHIPCTNLFSDALHRPFFCAHTPLTPYVTNIPPQNQIARLSNLSLESFTADWSDKPFILTDPVQQWPVYRQWSVETLLDRYRDVKFIAEAVEWTMKDYLDYMNNSSDESPLYLFDRRFVQTMGLTVGETEGADYWIPECFGEDLFSVLGLQRPHDRWLIIGPERSGSTFHKDPNATSAWNAVIRGAKYWIMFPGTPTSPLPPGVFVSSDQSEVTSPLSIAEWLLGFHSEARRMKGCIEGICGEGEVLHVPSGWWHLVVNIAPSIAITQNFIPRAHLPAALSFLKDKPDQVSGFSENVKNQYELFVQRMREQHPNILEEGIEKLNRMKEGRKRKWEELIKNDSPDHEARGGFSFGFGDDDLEDVP